MPPGYYPPYQEFHQGQQYWAAPWQPQWTQIRAPPPCNFQPNAPLEVTRPMPASTISKTPTQSSVGGMRPPFKATYTPIITRSMAATTGAKAKNPKSATVTSTCSKPLESAIAQNSGVSDLMAKNSGIGRPPLNQTHVVGLIPSTLAQNPVAKSPVVNTKGQ